MAELVERMKSLIPWDDKAATVTTDDLQADQGLRPRPEGEPESDGQAIVTPAGTPPASGGDRCRLAVHRRRDADRRGPPGKLRLRETSADLEGRAAHPASTGTAQQPGVVVRAGGAAESRRGWVRWRRNGCWPAATIFRS